MNPFCAAAAIFPAGKNKRLSIARALVHGGRILILDDSASALDFATDANSAPQFESFPPRRRPS